jgi:hypothetical protein
VGPFKLDLIAFVPHAHKIIERGFWRWFLGATP